MIYIGNKEYIPYIGNKAVEYIYIGDKLYYSAIRTHTVTYYVDTSVIYSEDVEEGNTCLSPTTFTPSKSGYTFTGWREDNTANSSVLSSKVMDDEDISLYAVFQKNIVLTTYNNSPNATTQTKQQYYNNGNVVNPSFTLTQNTQSGWTPLGWCTSSSATASVVVSNGGSVTLTSDATYYGKYAQTITLSYNGNGATGGSTAAQTGTRYFNSGNYSNPRFTLRSNGFSRTNYTFTKWAMGSASGTQYSAGASVTLSTNTTFYSVWKLQSVSSPSSLNIGNADWQADRYTSSKYIGPYNLTGVSTITFKLDVKACHGTRTDVQVGVSTDGSTNFTRASSVYQLQDHGGNGSNTYDTTTLSVNVSGLSGNYYLVHKVTISSYCYSYCSAITIS